MKRHGNNVLLGSYNTSVLGCLFFNGTTNSISMVEGTNISSYKCMRSIEIVDDG